MRQILLATCALFAMTSLAVADDFPGPKVRDSAPFNNKNVMMGGTISCSKNYTRQQFATARAQIIADVKQCVGRSFAITKDIGLDFGSDAHADCVVPSSYDMQPPANNPIWPVCCAVVGQNDSYRMACRLYFTPK